ncbi:hypothetical protein F5Y08DRAFT_349417 [Xylaria arbuscula]|nr:hypothetical protein F5Y08DRAFT_349417 [Xylaria arbuscula]
MNGSSKRRVFVAFFTHVPSSEGGIDWAIWTERKGSTGKGSCYRVVDISNPNNPYVPRNWQLYHYPGVNYTQGFPIIGRIMVGKVPVELNSHEFLDVLSTVPLPRYNHQPTENDTTWVKNALRALRRYGCVENFDLREFMLYALALGQFWNENPPEPNRYPMKNYTQRSFR